MHDCGYGELHDEMVEDCIVIGIRDSALAVKLQQDATLTLSKAVASAHQVQKPLMRGGNHTVKLDTQLGAVQQRRGKPATNRQNSMAGSPA